MPKQLTTQNATITTAAAEVKTLTISGKQVTQSVFRQLLEEPLIADDGTLNGVPWGYVNHCPDKKVADDNLTGRMIDCASGPYHLHVVWQRGTELRRNRVVPPNWWQPFYSEWADNFVQAAYCTNSHSTAAWMRHARREGIREIDFTLDGMKCSGNMPEFTHPNGHQCLTAADGETARQGLAEDIQSERERRDHYKASWQAIAELPQLFIAV